MPASALDHPLLGSLFGDPQTEAVFSVERELAEMLRFETALAEAQAEVGVIPVEAATAIRAACDRFDPDLDALAASTARDGVVVPGLIKSLRASVDERYSSFLHHGSTSQDVTDSALVLRLLDVFALFGERLTGLVDILQRLDDAFGDRPLMTRTRMQAALPMTVGDRLRIWRDPLADHAARIEELRRRVCRLQLGGAVGTSHVMGAATGAIAIAMGRLLDLTVPDRCWHTERAAILEFAGWLAAISGACAKIGQDIALMAQNEQNEVALGGGGGSSAMPHKQNPVRPEALVALHTATSAHLSGLSMALVHEYERSGTAWSVEWLLLPQMTIATGASLRLTAELLASIERIGTPDGMPS